MYKIILGNNSYITDLTREEVSTFLSLAMQLTDYKETTDKIIPTDPVMVSVEFVDCDKVTTGRNEKLEAELRAAKEEASRNYNWYTEANKKKSEFESQNTLLKEQVEKAMEKSE